MFKKNRAVQNTPTLTEFKPKYPKPKILLVDLGENVTMALKTVGYNVTTGSLGTPYKVKREQDNFFPVMINGVFPSGYKEQEIVVVDLHPIILEDPPKQETLQLAGPQWFARTDLGIVDPRSRLASAVRTDFDRISQHGGFFVIFASPPFPHELRLQDNQPLYSSSHGEEFYDAWDFLSDLDAIRVNADNGEEIQVANNLGPLNELLGAHISDAHFQCTLHPRYSPHEKWWIPLATNKFGAAVAGLMFHGEAPNPKLVFIFPQLQNKARFLTSFFSEVLPQLAPHLFPYFEGAKWVHRPEYELPRVRELQQQIEEVRKTAYREITILTDAISEERNANDYLYRLLTVSDADLVKAVEVALRILGFTSIVNVDEEMENAGKSGPKREDLQIHDASPIVLVEVKGVANLPREAAALQVHKYFAPRMKEWERTDVRGFSIVNHQRNLPALDRENRNPFQEDVITNASAHDFGLMTTWDLFRLVRSLMKNGWSHDQVREIFYRNGRIEPIPTHYRLIGVVEHIWPKVGAVGIRVQQDEICRGDRIAFEMPVEFEEQDVGSLQMDNQDVNRVGVGQLAGILTSLIGHGLREGMRVYQVTGRT
jgi:hypothetical protein